MVSENPLPFVCPGPGERARVRRGFRRGAVAQRHDTRRFPTGVFAPATRLRPGPSAVPRVISTP